MPEPGRFRFGILFPEKKDCFQFINVFLKILCLNVLGERWLWEVPSDECTDEDVK